MESDDKRRFAEGAAFAARLVVESGQYTGRHEYEWLCGCLKDLAEVYVADDDEAAQHEFLDSAAASISNIASKWKMLRDHIRNARKAGKRDAKR